MSLLDTVGTVLGLGNSAKSLFGGGGSSESSSLKKQYAWNAYSARNLPSAQVEGLRAAGLNPMLALGMGGSMPNAPPATISPGKDTELATAKQLATAQTLNLAADTALKQAAAAKTAQDTKVGVQEEALKNAEHNLVQVQSGYYGQQGITSHSQQLLNEASAKGVAQSERESQAREKQIGAQTRYTEVEINQAKEILKGQLLEGKIDETKFGEAMRYLNRLNPFAGTASRFKGR